MWPRGGAHRESNPEVDAVQRFKSGDAHASLGLLPLRNLHSCSCLCLSLLLSRSGGVSVRGRAPGLPLGRHGPARRGKKSASTGLEFFLGKSGESGENWESEFSTSAILCKFPNLNLHFAGEFPRGENEVGKT